VTLTVVNGTFHGASPGLTVTSGVVLVRSSTLLNATAAPTVLVTGGRPTLCDSTVQESTRFAKAAVAVTGGSLDLGTADDPGGNTLNVNGLGLLIVHLGAGAVPALGNTFAFHGAVLTSPYRVEDVIFHALDPFGGGLVSYAAGNVYVTPLSGSIQRGVDAVAPGGTVNVEGSAYAGCAVGDMLLTVRFQAGPALRLEADAEMPGADAGRRRDSRQRHDRLQPPGERREPALGRPTGPSQNLSRDRRRSRGEGDSRSAGNNVRQHGSEWRRHRVSGNRRRCSVCRTAARNGF
jgi:hypothetical protein